MVHQYSFEIERDSVTSELFVNDDNTLDLVDPDTGMVADYLSTKLDILKKMIEWMKTYGVKKVECNYILPE